MTVSGVAFAATWSAAMGAGLARDAALALAPTMLREVSIPGPCAASKFIARCLTWRFMRSAMLPVALVDHAVEDLPRQNWQVQRSTRLWGLIRRSLLAGLVRPVSVLTTGVLAEDRSKVAFVVGQHPVIAFGA